MMLFAFTSMPIFLLLVVSYYFSHEVENRTMLMAFLKGGLTLVPVVLLGYLIRGITGEPFSRAGVFAYHFFFDNFLFVALAVAGYCLIHGLPSGDEDARLLPAIGFLSGYFFVLTLAEWLMRFRVFDEYTSFFLPVIRMVFVLLLPVLLLSGSGSSGMMRVPWFIGAMLLPVCTASISYASRMNHPRTAAVISIALLAATVGAFHFQHKRV